MVFGISLRIHACNVSKARPKADDLGKWACKIQNSKKTVLAQVSELDSIVPECERYEFQPQCLEFDGDNLALHFDIPKTVEGKLRNLVLNASSSGTSKNVVLH